MLVSEFVDLEPLVSGPYVQPTGEQVNGWFFRSLIGARDPGLATELHGAARFKPFTLWAGRRFDASPEQAEQARGALALRVTSVSPRLSTFLTEHGPARWSTLRLGDQYFKPIVRRWLPDPATWRGRERFDALSNRWMTGPAVRPRVRLTFVAPTAFRGEHGNTLFPHGRLVFGSLARKWNANAPESLALDHAIVEGLIAGVRETAHHVWTVPASAFEESGFVGHCEYVVDRRAPREVAAALRLLSDFAFYAGVGLRTGWGMGQVMAE